VDTTGQRFIVEMQRGWQANIKERALYYTTFPITHQAQRGRNWDYELMPIYFVAVLDFRMDDGSSERTVKKDEPYFHKVKLMNVETKEVFYEKLTFVYIELPKLQKSLHELEEPADKWAYLLKHLVELQEVPRQFDSESFQAAFDIASEAALTPLERFQYEASLKQARDINAQVAGAHQKGHEAGRQEGREAGEQAKAIEIARSMLANGMTDELILNLTGLEQEVLERLKGTTA
jgi:predicted transposase/invertase (TIGR01784 family)